MTTPAGWYPQGDNLRYWDGAAWTEHIAPGRSTSPTALEIVGYVFAVLVPIIGAIIACAAAIGDRRSGSKHPARIVWLAVAVFVFEVVIGVLAAQSFS